MVARRGEEGGGEGGEGVGLEVSAGARGEPFVGKWGKGMSEGNTMAGDDIIMRSRWRDGEIWGMEGNEKLERVE